MSEDRADPDPDELLGDAEAKTRKEAENAVRQFSYVLTLIKSNVARRENFRIEPNLVRELNRMALAGVHRYAGQYRTRPVDIRNSSHIPPPAANVPVLIEDMCDYLNANLNEDPLRLSAYTLWRVNWIHPFADGNGRTARALSYVVLSIMSATVFPGTPTIPQQIAADKTKYFAALEIADHGWRSGKLYLSHMELMLERMLEVQLRNAAAAN